MSSAVQYKTPEKSRIEECPLYNNDLPVVSEMQHRVKNCYCHHCKCGKHKCPGEFTSKIGMKQNQSYYAKAFQKRKPYKMIKIVQQEPFHASKVPFRGESTQRSDYLPHKIEFQRSKSTAKLQKSNFIPRSKYQRDFIDWKIPGMQKFTHKGLPYREKSFYSPLQTSYQEMFSKHENFQQQSIIKPTDKLQDLFLDTSKINSTHNEHYKKLPISVERAKPNYQSDTRVGYLPKSLYKQEFQVKRSYERLPKRSIFTKN